MKKYTKRFERVCIECGQHYITKRRLRGSYCTQACGNAWRRANPGASPPLAKCVRRVDATELVLTETPEEQQVLVEVEERAPKPTASITINGGTAERIRTIVAILGVEPEPFIAKLVLDYGYQEAIEHTQAQLSILKEASSQ